MNRRCDGEKSISSKAAGCPLGRRQFLTRLGAAGCAAMALNSGLFRQSARAVMGAPKLPGDGAEKPRLMVGFARPDIERFYMAPGAGYPLAENQQLYTDIIEDAAADLDVTLDIEHAPLKDNDAVDAFLQEKGDADGALIVHMATRQNPEISHFLDTRPEGMPVVVYSPQGTRGWMIDGGPNCFVGATDQVDWLATATRMLKAHWQMAHTRFADFHGDEEREERLEPLGTVVHRMPMDWLMDAMRAAEDSEEAQEIAARFMEDAVEIVEPTENDILKAARNYVGLRRLMEETDSHAVTTDCLGLVREGDGSYVQCLAYCQLLDEGAPGVCERDIHPGLTLLLSGYLLDRPGFMANPSIHTATNEYAGFHCQVPTRMDGFTEPPHPYKIRPHHETQQGVTLQIDFKEDQPATLWRFIGDDTLRLGSGTIIRSMRPDHHEDGIGGCQNGYTMAVDGVDDVRVMAQYSHPVLTYGRHVETVAAWCELAGIDVVRGWT